MEKPELRPYQKSAIDRLAAFRKCSLIGPMGCGKTRIALEAVNSMCDTSKLLGDGVVLIVCKTNSIATWQEEIRKWCYEYDAVLLAIGTPKKREEAWKHFRAASERFIKGEYDSYKTFIITTYESLHRDHKSGWVPPIWACIADEFHKVRNHQSVMFKSLRSATRTASVLIPITGTIMRRGPQDTWTALNWTRSDLFGSYWKFVNTWCMIDDTPFGKEIIGPRNVENFKQEILSRYMVWIPDKEVEAFLPKRNRVLVPIEPTKTQQKFLRQLDKELIAEIGDGDVVVAPSILAKITRQRQMLCCPRILGGNEPGAALEAITERLIESQEKAVTIFMPFRRGMDHVKSYILEKEAASLVHLLHGGLSPADVAVRLHTFRTYGGILLCTIGYAESFDLEFCKVAYFLGFDWSPDANAQAEDRLRRLTSKHSVTNIYYMKHVNTIDGHVLNILNTKYRHVLASTPSPHHLYSMAALRQYGVT